MLLIERRLDARSTAEMTVDDLALLGTTLNSSETIKKYEFDNRPKRGGTIFGLVPMFLLYILMECRKTTYRGVVKNLSDHDCVCLGLTDRKGRPKRPSAATLNGFVNKKLVKISDIIGKETVSAVLRTSSKLIITIDSTPAEASRYNFDADFNPYYNVRMDKCHIIMVNGFPMFMVQSRGNDGDNPYAETLIRMLSGCDLGGKEIEIHLDGAYDAFLTFAVAYMVTGVIMRCNIRSYAVYSGVDDEKLRDEYAGMWKKKGFDPHRKNDVDFMLRFLFRNGKEELAGQYIRDRSMELDKKEERTTARFVCETMHRSMKRWIDFSIFRIRRATKLVRMRCRFLCVQLLSTLFREYLDTS